MNSCGKIIIPTETYLDNQLDILARVINNSTNLMPFSFGLHPYFSIKDFSYVRIDGLTKECINQKDMINSNTYFELERLADGIDILAGPTPSTILFDLLDKVSVEMKSKEPLDLTVIWTDPPRKMVCLEPWTSPRNSLNTGEKIIRLPPGESRELNCKFIINKYV